jgi:hypothetical protein
MARIHDLIGPRHVEMGFPHPYAIADIAIRTREVALIKVHEAKAIDLHPMTLADMAPISGIGDARAELIALTRRLYFHDATGLCFAAVQDGRDKGRLEGKVSLFHEV